jgi:hypothetical protein
MNEPIENSKQLPIAWVYPEFMKNIKDAKCWTAYSTYHEERPIPLFTHPMRELTDEKIAEIYHSENRFSPQGTFAYHGFAKDIIKASRGEK